MFEYCVRVVEIFVFLLFTVIYASGVCILIDSCFFFLIGCVGLVGIFWRAGSRTYSCVWVSAVWSAGPVRVYLATSLVWVAGLYGFSVFFALVLAGTVRLNRWGWRDSTDFLFSWLRFGVYSTIETVGGVLYFSFHFPQFVVNCLGGWICAVGILRFIFYGIL